MTRYGKSLGRLSSGNRINSPSDDAGGMAVAYKMESTLKRTEAAIQNSQNGLSYLQVQDGALKTVGNILTRMSELRTMSMDITKNDGDIENYSKEFIELQSQINQIGKQQFNGISLFATNDASCPPVCLTIVTLRPMVEVALMRHSPRHCTHLHQVWKKMVVYHSML